MINGETSDVSMMSAENQVQQAQALTFQHG